MKSSSKKWDLNINHLLTNLSDEDKYVCVAGIPGPSFEMRSGTLPDGLSFGHGILNFSYKIGKTTNLDYKKINDYQKKLAKNYSPIKILDRCSKICSNFSSFAILITDYINYFLRRLFGKPNENATDKIRTINLRVYRKNIEITYPANLVSLGLVWEIFAEEVYFLKNEVDCIYDLGANIGLSAIYFRLLNPSAKIVCVEPMKENIDLLKLNLSKNKVNAEIIEAAAGKERGETTLFFSGQSHALPSLCTKQSYSRKISTIPFDEIIKGDRYGIKIDIEGSEAYLSEFPTIIKNASWIVGELHYSGDKERDALIDKLFSLIENNFVVEKGRPIVYFVGSNALLCKTFKAINKKSYQ